MRYIGWLDHDTVFRNRRWLSQAIEQIDDGAPAVQLFERIHFLDRHGHVSRSAMGAMSSWIERKSSKGSPGGAWLANRQWLDQIGGLYDKHIIGGGDRTFFDACTGKYGHHVGQHSQLHQRDLKQWVDRAIAHRNGAPCGYLLTEAYHLWHGDRRNRQYRTRDLIPSRAMLDPTKDVRINADGILEWCSNKPALHSQISRFFAHRREDT